MSHCPAHAHPPADLISAGVGMSLGIVGCSLQGSQIKHHLISSRAGTSPLPLTHTSALLPRLLHKSSQTHNRKMMEKAKAEGQEGWRAQQRTRVGLSTHRTGNSRLLVTDTTAQCESQLGMLLVLVSHTSRITALPHHSCSWSWTQTWLLDCHCNKWGDWMLWRESPEPKWHKGR